MTIRTKPSTADYREGWERCFGKNAKAQLYGLTGAEGVTGGRYVEWAEDVPGKGIVNRRREVKYGAISGANGQHVSGAAVRKAVAKANHTLDMTAWVAK